MVETGNNYMYKTLSPHLQAAQIIIQVFVGIPVRLPAGAGQKHCTSVILSYKLNNESDHSIQCFFCGSAFSSKIIDGPNREGAGKLPTSLRAASDTSRNPSS